MKVLVLLENRHLLRETLMATLDNSDKVIAQEANARLKESDEKNKRYRKIIIDMFNSNLTKNNNNYF